MRTKLAVIFLGILTLLLFIRVENETASCHNAVQDLGLRLELFTKYIKLQE